MSKKQSTMIERSYNDVRVVGSRDEEFAPTATIKASAYPDGTYKNDMSPDELREFARILNEVADELEVDE